MRRLANAVGKLNQSKMSYGVFVLCATTVIALPAQTFTTLHSFDNTDGASPNAALVQGTDANLYGTTLDGGAAGLGTVFKISPSGALTTLHGFDGADGEYLFSGLVQATNGDFYGTTSDFVGPGHGTVFKITPGGALTTLYSFCSQSACTDGEYPYAGLIEAASGDFYGTTSQGGAGSPAYGTIFRITPSGTLTTLYSFCSQSACADGEQPFAGLVQGTDGDFYGTTAAGGANGYGTIFKITRSGTLTTLYSFCSQSGCTDGKNPLAGLAQATNGDFYGTTQQGGANCVPDGCGTVFKITPGGMLTTLYSFCAQSGCTDGSIPYAGLIQATNGDLYGTTADGGANGNYGTIFKITPGGALTTLYSFCSQSGCTDGAYPNGGLVQATNGDFYGTTTSGGANIAYGTVFALSVGLGPFVKTEPTSGEVGTAVKILGTNLTGASSVTFNGTPAAFLVSSRPKITEITALVPVGASSGTVQVVIPSGTLSSNVPFRVLP